MSLIGILPMSPQVIQKATRDGLKDRPVVQCRLIEKYPESKLLRRLPCQGQHSEKCLISTRDQNSRNVRRQCG